MTFRGRKWLLCHREAKPKGEKRTANYGHEDPWISCVTTLGLIRPWESPAMEAGPYR